MITHFGVPPERAVNLGINAVLTQERLDQLDVPTDRIPGRVIAVGRLSPEKDFATLITAFAQVPGELVILGEGPERERLERLNIQLGLAHRVSLPGHVDDPLALVASSRLFVSASRHEGFGNAIVEALACGTPVVATDVPYGPAAILAGGRFGTLVPPGDPAALAAAIRCALTQPVNRALLRGRAADFTTERATARFAAELGALGFVSSPALPVPA